MGYNIELDQRRVLNDAADLLFTYVDKDGQLRSWLNDFAKSKIREGKNWNFKQEILDVGNEVFKEEFKNFSDKVIEKLYNKNLVSLYIKI